MTKKPRLTPFEQQRKTWCEQGYPVLANAHTDGLLLAWAQRTGRVYWIDRQTRWGNPFKLRKGATLAERERVVQQYASWFVDQYPLQVTLNELDGKVLVCHCTPLPCHGEVLLCWYTPQFAVEYSVTCADLRHRDRLSMPPPSAVVTGQQLPLWER